MKKVCILLVHITYVNVTSVATDSKVRLRYASVPEYM